MTLTATGGTVAGHLLGGQTAAAVRRWPAVPDTDDVPGLDRQKQRHAVRPAGFLFGLLLAPVLILAKVDLALLYGALNWWNIWPMASTGFARRGDDGDLQGYQPVPGVDPGRLLAERGFRMLAIVFARGLDETSEILTWVRAVATAISSPASSPS